MFPQGQRWINGKVILLYLTSDAFFQFHNQIRMGTVKEVYLEVL